MNNYDTMIAGGSPMEMPIDVSATVGGRNPALADRWFIPARVSTIQGDAGFLPSTLKKPSSIMNHSQVVIC